MMTLRTGVAAALMGAAIMMTGCTGTGLTGAGASTTTTGGTSGGVSTGGAACATNTAGPAAAPTTGNAAEGNYNGLTLPNGWDTQYSSQAGVDSGFTNLKANNPSAWTTAKCIYQPAIAKWSMNTGNTP